VTQYGLDVETCHLKYGKEVCEAVTRVEMQSQEVAQAVISRAFIANKEVK